MGNTVLYINFACMKNVIYKIVNIKNGFVYVGRTSNFKRRFMEHKSRFNTSKKTSPLYIDMVLYGFESFKFEIIEVVENKHDLPKREEFWIEKLNPKYNKNLGGLGNKGYVVKEQTKKRLSEIGKNQWDNLSDDEKKDRISNNLKGPKKGHEVSLITRKKISDKIKGRKLPKEHIENIRKALKGKYRPNTKHKKPVIGVSVKDGHLIKAESVKEAAEMLNIHPSSITKVLTKKAKTCGGYVWKYGV